MPPGSGELRPRAARRRDPLGLRLPYLRADSRFPHWLGFCIPFCSPGSTTAGHGEARGNRIQHWLPWACRRRRQEGRSSVGRDAAMEMDSLVPHHAAAPWSLPAPQTLAEREELLLVQHAMEGCSDGEASAAGRPPPPTPIHDSEQQASSVDDDDNQGIHCHDDALHMVQLGYNLLYRVTATMVVCGIDYNLLSCESVSYL